jgi:hypothetical protein
MRLHAIALGLMLVVTSAASFAQSGHYTTSGTPIGVILDDPAAKAVLNKYAPQIANGAHISMARGVTLASLQQFAPDVLNDQVLAHIDAGLAKLPAKR